MRWWVVYTLGKMLMIVMVNCTYNCLIVNIAISVLVCICLRKNMRSISRKNHAVLWMVSLLPRCVFSNKTVKTWFILFLFVTSIGYSSTTHVYIHAFIENHMSLIWLTSSRLTPDVHFIFLSWCISYASYSTLHLLIIEIIFFFSLLTTRGKKHSGARTLFYIKNSIISFFPSQPYYSLNCGHGPYVCLN